MFETTMEYSARDYQDIKCHMSSLLLFQHPVVSGEYRERTSISFTNGIIDGQL